MTYISPMNGDNIYLSGVFFPLEFGPWRDGRAHLFPCRISPLILLPTDRGEVEKAQYPTLLPSLNSYQSISDSDFLLWKKHNIQDKFSRHRAKRY